MGDFADLGGAVHRHSGADGAVVAQVAAGRRGGGIRKDHGEDRTVVDRRAAGHAGAAVRLSGRSDPEAACGHRPACRDRKSVV